VGTNNRAAEQTMMAVLRLVRLLLAAGAAASIGSSSTIDSGDGDGAGISSCSDAEVQDLFPYQWTNNNVTAIGPDMAQDPFAAESASTCGKAWCVEASRAAAGPSAAPSRC
jgi:hypothetical protein